MNDEGITGNSIAAIRLTRVVDRLSKVDYPVLISGEGGTGKEHIASLIHSNSKRSRAPFIVCNTASVPESHSNVKLFGKTDGDNSFRGIAEDAHEGTLFIKNVDGLASESQANLGSMVLNDEFFRDGEAAPIPCDVRLICSTEQDLAKLSARGEFNAELARNLLEYNVIAPPLRERREDIPDLADRFLEKARKKLRINKPVMTTEFLERLVISDWPRNISQLENTITSAVTMSEKGVIDLNYIPDLIISGEPDYVKSLLTALKDQTRRKYKKFLDNVEEALIKTTLLEMNYHQVRTAKLFGIDESTFRRKLEKYGIPSKRERKRLMNQD